jgi:hypothetical protein
MSHQHTHHRKARRTSIKLFTAMWCILSCILLFFVFAQSTHAATRALLIGADLKPQFVNLQAMGKKQISFFDADRRLQIKSVNEVLQIRLLHSAESTRKAETLSRSASDKINEENVAARLPVRADLVDGQRLVSQWSDTIDDGETLVFKHKLLGQTRVKLDVLARLWRDSTKAHFAETPRTDTIALANGDVMTGFIVKLERDAVLVQIKGSKTPINLPLSRVAAVLLANPMTHVASSNKPNGGDDDKTETGKHMIWLRDGSRLLSNKLEIGNDKLTIAPAMIAGRDVTISLTEVVRIEIASTVGRLIDLTELPYKVIAGGDVFGLKVPPRTVGSSLRLHAPVTLLITLPKGVTRFAGMAMLDKQADRRWASCVVKIRTGKQVLGKHQLNARTPNAQINILLGSAGSDRPPAMTIELDSGINGPVMDRVWLRDAMLFVKSK